MQGKELVCVGATSIECKYAMSTSINHVLQRNNNNNYRHLFRFPFIENQFVSFVAACTQRDGCIGLLSGSLMKLSPED